jgi:hypothetical protein
MDSSTCTTIPCVPMDPRPTLDVENLESPSELTKKRRRTMKRAVHRSTRASDVVSKYRRKQRRLLDGDSDSDPDPYDPDYIFYCLDA